jgi:hypothetical protein
MIEKMADNLMALLLDAAQNSRGESFYDRAIAMVKAVPYTDEQEPQFTEWLEGGTLGAKGLPLTDNASAAFQEGWRWGKAWKESN